MRTCTSCCKQITKSSRTDPYLCRDCEGVSGEERFNCFR